MTADASPAIAAMTACAALFPEALRRQAVRKVTADIWQRDHA